LWRRSRTTTTVWPPTSPTPTRWIRRTT
jgi:hypothetical protein